MGQAQVSLRGRISGMDQRWQAESSRVSRIEGGQSTNGSRARAFGGVAKVNFSGSAKSDLYPGLVENAKVVKPSELPIMRARDISRRFWCKFQKRSARGPGRPRRKGVTRLPNRA